MTAQSAPAVIKSRVETTQDFSLFQGGPVFKSLQRAHLSGPKLEMLDRRVGALVFVSWVPLLILSVIDGNAWGSHIRLSFLADVGSHARFLISLPLLLAAESVAFQRMRHFVGQFKERHLIPHDKEHAVDEAIRSAIPVA